VCVAAAAAETSAVSPGPLFVDSPSLPPGAEKFCEANLDRVREEIKSELGGAVLKFAGIGIGLEI
jgi:hypothetical protein